MTTVNPGRIRVLMRAIFWDMDGTLVDSEPLWGIATYRLSEKLGRRIGPEERARTIGGSFRNTLAICAEFAGRDIAELDVDRLHDEFFGYAGELMRERLEPRPGVTELLSELHAEGVPMLVATNTERILADASIDAVGRDFFVGSVTGDEVPRFKPAPDIYLRAAELIGEAPRDCLVFEDSAAGMAAATAADCAVVGLPAEDTTPIPAPGLAMRDLAGSTSFVGVRAGDVVEWFDRARRAMA